MIRSSFLLLSILCVLTVLQPPPAQATIMEFFFGKKQEGPDPAQTGIAPFAYDATKNVERLKGLPENAVPLHLPHRTVTHITEWVVTAASEVMTFEKGNHQADLEEKHGTFDEDGWKQFNQFLQEKNILKVLESEKFYVRSFVSDSPVLLNENAIHGRYRWLYEVPMMVSYMDRDMKSYKKADAVNQQVILKIQIGRSADGSGPEGMKIEQFSGKVEALDKK